MQSKASLRPDVATVNDMLARAARQGEHGLRLVDRSEEAVWMSWAEVYRRAVELAGRLQAAGVGQGDRVALVFSTCSEFFDGLFGTMLAGGVPVPLYPPVRFGRLAEYHRRTAAMMAASGAVLVLAERRVHRILGQSVELASPALGCYTPDRLPTGPLRPIEVAPGDLALVQFSSGTTVSPKPVALSHRAVVAQATILNHFWPPHEGLEDSGVSWLPLYHDMGLIGCILPALERPGTLTLIPPEVFVSRPAIWLRTISRYRATLSPAPNFAYGLCVDKIRDGELDGVDLTSWRVALNGAEPVAPKVLRAFQQRFARWGFREEALTPVYGLSEAALAVTFSALDSAFVATRFDRSALNGAGQAVEEAEGFELVSVGRPLPGFELQIVDESGRELKPARVGRVRVSGPSLMDGYLGRPEDTARVLCDGWLDTGDLGFIHHGELYITGRAKDVLVLRGRNHAPEEVEQAIDGIEGVRTGCSVAVSWLADGASSEQLLVMAEVRRNVIAKEHAGIADACRSAVLAATGLEVHRMVVLEAGTLPRTSSGKLLRSEALRLYLTGDLTPPEPVNAWRLAGAVARSQLAYARMGWRTSGVED